MCRLQKLTFRLSMNLASKTVPNLTPFQQHLLSDANFAAFLKKLLEYTDEIYYVEKKRKLLELSTGRDGIGNALYNSKMRVKLLPSEIERIDLKAQECAYAYTGILFKTVWKPNLKWEKIINEILKMVRQAYAEEKNPEIVDSLVTGSLRLL